MVNSFFGGIASSSPTTAQRFPKDLPESRRDVYSLGNSRNSLDANFPTLEWNTVFSNLSTSLFSSLPTPGELLQNNQSAAPSPQLPEPRPHQIDPDQDEDENPGDTGNRMRSSESALLPSQLLANSELKESSPDQLPSDGHRAGRQDSAMDSRLKNSEGGRSRIGQIHPRHNTPIHNQASGDALESGDPIDRLTSAKRNLAQQIQDSIDSTAAPLVTQSSRERQQAMDNRVLALDREAKTSSSDDSVKLDVHLEDGIESDSDIESIKVRPSKKVAEENIGNNHGNPRSERSKKSRQALNARVSGSSADANSESRSSNSQATGNLEAAGKRDSGAEPVPENFEDNPSADSREPMVEQEVTVPSSEPAANNLEKNVRATLPAASNKVLNPSPVQSASEQSGMSPSSSTVSRIDPKAGDSPSERIQAGPKQMESNEATSQIDRLRLIQRVARSFSRLGSESGSVQLRLHPPELGTLSMRVRLEGRKLSASLIAESSTARDVILESLPQLRTRLAEQGYEVSQFSVDIADSDSGTQAQSNPWDQADPGKGDSTESRTGFTRSNRSDAVRDDAEPSNAANWNGMSAAGHGSLGGIDVKA